MEKEGAHPLEIFDPYLLAEIFKFLDWDYLPTLALVCRNWHQATKDTLLREHLEPTRKVVYVGKLPQNMPSYVRSLASWKGLLAVGGDAKIHLLEEIVNDTQMTEKKVLPSFNLVHVLQEEAEGTIIESLVVWQPVKEGITDTFLVSGSDKGIVVIWKMVEEEDASDSSTNNRYTFHKVSAKAYKGTAVRLCVWDRSLMLGNDHTIVELSSQGEELRKFTSTRHENTISRLCCWKDHLCVAFFSGGVDIFSQDGQLVKEAFKGSVRNVFVWNDTHLVCCTDSIFGIHILDEDYHLVESSTPFAGAIFGLLQKGRRLVIVDGGKTLTVFEFKGTKGTLAKVQELKHHNDQIYAITWHNGRMYTGDYRGEMHVWM